MGQTRKNPESLIECSLKCGAFIRFIQSVKWSNETQSYIMGSKIPVDSKLQTGDNKMTLVVIHPPEFRGRVIPRADSFYQGFEPHFASCSVYKKRQNQLRRPRRKKVKRDPQLKLEF